MKLLKYTALLLVWVLQGLALTLLSILALVVSPIFHGLDRVYVYGRTNREAFDGSITPYDPLIIITIIPLLLFLYIRSSIYWAMSKVSKPLFN